MANIYVRFTDGNNADNGSTWALAKATLAGAAGIDAAGDTIYVSQAHAESTAGNVSVAIAGTPATPSRILCGDDAAAPPTALATTATATTTSSGTLSLSGSFYCYGITFISNEALTLVSDTGGTGCVQEYKNCSFQNTNTGSAGQINFGGANNYTPRLKLTDCTLKYAATGNRSIVCSATEINGGSILSGTTTPTYVFSFATDRTQGRLLVSGFDFSNLSSTMVLCNGAGAGIGTMVFRNCKLPASWTGTLITGTIPGPGARYEMHNCDSTDTNYRMWVEDYAGSIQSETTVVRTGGASDGTTTLSWKMVTSANAEFPVVPLVSPEGALWNDTTGSKTLTVEVLHFAQGAGTSGAIQDDEAWVEVMYLGASGVPLGAWITDCKADVLATAADQTTTTESWDGVAAAYSAATNYVVGDIIKPTTPNGAVYQLTTDAGTTSAEPTWGTTDGGTTADAAGRVWTRSNRQKLHTASFTANEKGVITWRVVCAKASKTLYVCPKAELV